VQHASIRSVVFDPSLINPAYPDYDRMRQIVQESLAPAAALPAAAPDDAPSTGAAASATEPSSTVPAAPSTAAGPATDVGDACAYDAAQAEKALAQGQPPTKNG
jgi:hypothetical protein